MTWRATYRGHVTGPTPLREERSIEHLTSKRLFGLQMPRGSISLPGQLPSKSLSESQGDFGSFGRERPGRISGNRY
jgi:hypothetical protein